MIVNGLPDTYQLKSSATHWNKLSVYHKSLLFNIFNLNSSQYSICSLIFVKLTKESYKRTVHVKFSDHGTLVCADDL